MRLKLSIGVVLAALLAALAIAPLAVARMHASASEFKFKLSTKTAHHGVVIFKVKNVGKIVHDFKIAGKKTANLGAGKSATLKVTLKKGTYKYLCTIDSHASFGMKGSFKAT